MPYLGGSDVWLDESADVGEASTLLCRLVFDGSASPPPLLLEAPLASPPSPLVPPTAVSGFRFMLPSFSGCSAVYGGVLCCLCLSDDGQVTLWGEKGLVRTFLRPTQAPSCRRRRVVFNMAYGSAWMKQQREPEL